MILITSVRNISNGYCVASVRRFAFVLSETARFPDDELVRSRESFVTLAFTRQEAGIPDELRESDPAA